MRYLILTIAVVSSIATADCIIDGAMVPRCIGPVPVAYEGVSYPVFTADNPAEVVAESNRRYGGDSIVPYLPRSQAISVKHVRINTPEQYPEVTCFDFYIKGVKRSQTCFDTMEITER